MKNEEPGASGQTKVVDLGEMVRDGCGDWSGWQPTQGTDGGPVGVGRGWTETAFSPGARGRQWAAGGDRRPLALDRACHASASASMLQMPGLKAQGCQSRNGAEMGRWALLRPGHQTLGHCHYGTIGIRGPRPKASTHDDAAERATAPLGLSPAACLSTRMAASVLRLQTLLLRASICYSHTPVTPCPIAACVRRAV